MAKISKEKAIQRARDLGFTVEYREWWASDYTLKLNQDTFEEKKVWSTTKQKGYWITFPPDYAHPAMLATTTSDILFAIEEYENRFEAMREAREKTQQTEQAMEAFKKKFGANPTH